jgi:hypothetical protein
MSGKRVIYCGSCHVFRIIRNWHEHREALVIELEPCGHVVHRNAGLEWSVRAEAA